MRQITPEQLLTRIRTENPWWSGGGTGSEIESLRPRAYFNLFYPLVTELNIRRAVVLMGPRRVGKTILIHHVIQELLRSGTSQKQITYVSIDHPLYNGLGLEELIDLSEQAVKPDVSETAYIFFDEIQYLKDWEIHLKSLVDDRPHLRIVVSGSSAAALNLKSHESGAGRFTDFHLPPLSFFEYMTLLNLDGMMSVPTGSEQPMSRAQDIGRLNSYFLDYINYGGYPEVVFSPVIRSNPSRFIKADIIDKVLLRDLPSLYGISDVKELNKLFATLAFNTADELSLQELSMNSGVSKNTIKRYIEYLEAAFLIRIVHKISESARRFSRARAFKVYLTNPSMRTALFAPVSEDSSEVGALVETAVFSNFFQNEPDNLYYSRWKKGEVDMVRLNSAQQPFSAIEIKWSDRFPDRPHELRSLLEFCKNNNLPRGLVTTRTIRTTTTIHGVQLSFVPASELCYTMGYFAIHGSPAGDHDLF